MLVSLFLWLHLSTVAITWFSLRAINKSHLIWNQPSVTQWQNFLLSVKMIFVVPIRNCSSIKMSSAYLISRIFPLSGSITNTQTHIQTHTRHSCINTTNLRSTQPYSIYFIIIRSIIRSTEGVPFSNLRIHLGYWSCSSSHNVILTVNDCICINVSSLFLIWRKNWKKNVTRLVK